MPKQLTLVEWVRERLENCNAIAAAKRGLDRASWLEDAHYFECILELLTAAEESGVHVSSGGRSPDEKRFSKRDVEAMIAIAMAVQKKKPAND